MKCRHWFSMFVMTTLWLTVGTIATAQGLADSDWPKLGKDLLSTGQSSFIGPQGNQDNTVDQAWANYWNGGNGGAVVDANGRIYVSGLAVFNPDGTPRWSYKVSAPGSTPTLAADGTVYVGDDSGGCLAAITESTDVNGHPVGDLLWQFPVLGSPQNSATICSDGVVLFGTQGAGRLYAIDPNNDPNNPSAVPKWVYTPSPAAAIETVAAVDETRRVVYCGTSSKLLLAIDLDTGKLKWKLSLGEHVHGDPAIGADGTIYTTTRTYVLYAVSPQGTKKWSAKLAAGKVTASTSACFPAIYRANGVETIYVGGKSGLYSFTTAGKLRSGWPVPSARIARHLAIDDAGTVYASSDNGEVMAVTSTGQKIWSFMTEGAGHLAIVESNHPNSTTNEGDLLYMGDHLRRFQDGGTCPPRIWDFFGNAVFDESGSLGTVGELYVGMIANAVDGNGTIMTLSYYHDSNDNGQLELGVGGDTLLEPSEENDNGIYRPHDALYIRYGVWQAMAPNRFFAVAVDDQNNLSYATAAMDGTPSGSF